MSENIRPVRMSGLENKTRWTLCPREPVRMSTYLQVTNNLPLPLRGIPPPNRQEVTDDGGRGRPTAMQPARSRHASVQASHEASEASEADGVIDALAGMRSSLGLEAPLPTRRDRRAVGGLLERVRSRNADGERTSAKDEVLRVIAWIPSNTFWLRRAMTGRALVANWPDIVNDYAVDLIDKQRAYEAQAAERDKPRPERGPHRHTWLCSHVLAELGCTSEQVQAGEHLQEQAWQIAFRMNAGAQERTSANTGAHPVREGGA